MKMQQFSFIFNWTSSDPVVTVNTGHINDCCRRHVQCLRLIRRDSTFTPLHPATLELLIMFLGDTANYTTKCLLQNPATLVA